MNHVDQCYAAVSEQITQLLADAKEASASPIGMARIIGSTWLAAEMYDRNERAYQRATAARTGIIQALERRITWLYYQRAQADGPVADITNGWEKHR